ncbi:suppressor of cytokine signaling 3-like [Platysternon megacephalum]|uniref:Suppressor of cytokine signaling 3-like n=1 Tax=Platysternon megacephalum TaxID=55544 RepID=A0A4D9DMN5_9SAUR|nr:suppressor of cytokine signaling 3-like [Platysternon megacephalum]
MCIWDNNMNPRENCLLFLTMVASQWYLREKRPTPTPPLLQSPSSSPLSYSCLQRFPLCLPYVMAAPQTAPLVQSPRLAPAYGMSYDSISPPILTHSVHSSIQF